jgi:hypothetical protein
VVGIGILHSSSERGKKSGDCQVVCVHDLDREVRALKRRKKGETLSSQVKYIAIVDHRESCERQTSKSPAQICRISDNHRNNKTPKVFPRALQRGAGFQQVLWSAAEDEPVVGRWRFGSYRKLSWWPHAALCALQ